MFLINFNQWNRACVGVNNWVLDRYSKNDQISNFMEIRSVGATQKERRDMTKLVVAFRNVANAPKQHFWTISTHKLYLTRSNPKINHE